MSETLSISQALAILQGCDHLKVSASHVSASVFRTLEEVEALRRKGVSFGDERLYRKSKVAIRRRRDETLEDMLVRAATLVFSEHMPVQQKRTVTNHTKCFCGSADSVRWHTQLKQHCCARCSAMWDSAKFHHDMSNKHAVKQ